MKKWVKWTIGVTAAFAIVGSFADTDEPEEKEKVAEEVKVTKEKKVEPEFTVNNDMILKEFNDIASKSNGVILDVDLDKDDYSVQIRVDGNVWEESSETDKIYFAEANSETITMILTREKAIELGEKAYVSYYDENGYLLANKGWSGEYNIKR